MFPDFEINKWDLIFDFTPQESGTLNYSFVEPKDWSMNKFPVDGMKEQPVVAFAYPVRYGGKIPDDAYFGEDKNVDKGGMIAFDIKTSANAAAQFAENQEKLEQKAREEKKEKETAAVGNLANIAAAAAANRVKDL